MSNRVYNPKGYNLKTLNSIAIKFDCADGDDVDDVLEFIKEYNGIEGDQIVAWLATYNGDDFIQNKITFIFYLV